MEVASLRKMLVEVEVVVVGLEYVPDTVSVLVGPTAGLPLLLGSATTSLPVGLTHAFRPAGSGLGALMALIKLPMVEARLRGGGGSIYGRSVGLCGHGIGCGQTAAVGDINKLQVSCRVQRSLVAGGGGAGACDGNAITADA